MPRSPQLNALVTPKERWYYAALVVVSVAVYAGLVMYAVKNVQVGGMVIYYLVLIAGVYLAMHGLLIGRIRGNGVRVNEWQFPVLHRMVVQHADTLGLRKIPDVFVLQAGGLLNAFATRFVGRDFVVIYTDVLALAQERGETAVGFIVAHELGHIARGHLRQRWLIMPGRLIPYLGTAYSRACEYTCDRFGAHCQPDGAVDGLLVLAAGRELYRHVDARLYAQQVQTETGFWPWYTEVLSTHPHLPKRVAALMERGVPAPSYTPMILDGERLRR